MVEAPLPWAPGCWTETSYARDEILICSFADPGSIPGESTNMTANELWRFFMKRFVVRLGVVVVVTSAFWTYCYATNQSPAKVEKRLSAALAEWRQEESEKKLSAALAKCNASLTHLSSVERDPCRFICSDTSDKVLWVQPLDESVCKNLP